MVTGPCLQRNVGSNLPLDVPGGSNHGRTVLAHRRQFVERNAVALVPEEN